MADLSQSVCLNHPGNQAVARCSACGKPVCQQCVVERGGCSYCSVECADKAEQAFDRVVSVIESSNRSEKRAALRSFILIIILIAIAAAAYFYYVNNKDKVEKAVQKTEKQIKKAEQNVQKKAADTKADIQEKVPGDSKYKKDRENMVK